MPTSPRNDSSTFLEPSRHVRFSPDSFDTQERRQLEMYNPHPILFVSLPEKFDPKKTDVRHTFRHETRRIIVNNQFSLHEETAYIELKTLLIQLYDKKATSNLELKRQFTERVQNQYENVHLYASQLKVLAKQSYPELLQYQKDDLIKEQFIRGLKDKMLRTRLQMMREESSLEEIIDEAARYEKAVSDVLEFPERSKKVEFEEKIEKYYYKPQNPSHQQQHSQQQQQSYQSKSDVTSMHGYCKGNNKKVRFLADTGSNYSILSDRTCNVKVKVKINREKNDLETIVVKNFVNDFILGLDGLEKFETPRRLLDGLKNGLQVQFSNLNLTIDTTKFVDKFCKDVLIEYSNNINSKTTTKMSEIDEQKLNKDREETYKTIVDISATNLTDLTPTSDTNHTIELADKTPFCIRTRPVPYAKKEEFKKLIEEMLEANLIRPSKSQYSSPVHLVKKPDGGI
ncbi:unnamed protein product, partial [Brachionus calyciflorus]